MYIHICVCMYMYMYIYIYMYVYIYIYIHTCISAYMCVCIYIYIHYTYYTCHVLICHKDHYTLLLNKPCVRQAELDKWSPSRLTSINSGKSGVFKPTVLFRVVGFDQPSVPTIPHPPPLSRPRYDIFSWAVHIDRPYGALIIFHTGGSVVGVSYYINYCNSNYQISI